MRNWEVFTDASQAERFWGRVAMSSNNVACWWWLGETWRGYGRVWFEGRKARAHRLAYEFCFGPIPAGLNVLHRCDSPACCNPAHLFAGTQKDNVDDMIHKGRSAVVGVSHSRYVRGRHVKLDDEAVRRIKASGENNRKWARRLGVSESSVSRARRGLTFREAT